MSPRGIKLCLLKGTDGQGIFTSEAISSSYFID